jgi:hypothetical protein
VRPAQSGGPVSRPERGRVFEGLDGALALAWPFRGRIASVGAKSMAYPGLAYSNRADIGTVYRWMSRSFCRRAMTRSRPS